MTQTYNNTNLRKGKHLSYSERCQIAILKKESYSNRQIAKVLGRVPQTINNEISRGTITQLKRQIQNGKVYETYYSVYDADAGQAFYEKQRLNCGRRPKWAKTLGPAKLLCNVALGACPRLIECAAVSLQPKHS